MLPGLIMDCELSLCGHFATITVMRESTHPSERLNFVTYLFETEPIFGKEFSKDLSRARIHRHKNTLSGEKAARPL